MPKILFKPGDSGDVVHQLMPSWWFFCNLRTMFWVIFLDKTMAIWIYILNERKKWWSQNGCEQESIHFPLKNAQSRLSMLADARPNMDLEWVLQLWFVARFATFLATAHLSVCSVCTVVSSVYMMSSFPWFRVQTSASSPYSRHKSFGSSLFPSMSNRDPSSNAVHLILMLQLPLLSESWPAPSQWFLHLSPFASRWWQVCL